MQWRREDRKENEIKFQHAVVETKMTAGPTRNAIQRVKIGGAGMRHGRSTLVVGDKGWFETGLFESSTDGRRISGECGFVQRLATPSHSRY